VSRSAPAQRLSVTEIRSRKGDQKLVCLTAYSAPGAALIDPYVDMILVADSVGVVVHGMQSTVGVTLDMMIMHAQAVMRGSSRALVVVDLPFGTYEQSSQVAYESAVKVIRATGAQAVKIEATENTAPIIGFLVARGIQVMGHIGLRPLAAASGGGDASVKGRQASERERAVKDARMAVQAGAFALVLDGVGRDVADFITREVNVPTIGHGASPDCDGQILITEDMLGVFESTPKFVRRYADLRETISQAVGTYARDVRRGQFPSLSEIYILRAG
jgi:3-methyl-2-oxobutanoate hydroxymethyltransferase